jgi:hypothetical protein
MCFESKKAAQEDIARIKAKKIFRSKNTNKATKSKTNGKTRPYYCWRCDAWHLTTIPANISRIVKNRLKRNNR